jgi:cytochrome P450
MGRDFRSLQKNDNPVAESFFRLREPSFEKLVFFAINFVLPQWLARRLPLRMNKVINDEANFLRGLCQDIVSDKRQALNISKNLVKDLEADILGTMMLGGDFSDAELVDQMLTFLAGGVSFTFNFQCSNRCVVDYIVRLVKSAS